MLLPLDSYQGEFLLWDDLMIFLNENVEKDIIFRPMKTKNLLKVFGKRIELACRDQGKVNMLVNNIKRYFDKNSEAIYNQAPLDRILFTPANQDIMIEFIGDDPHLFNKEFLETMEQTYRKTEYNWVLAVHQLKFAFSFLTLAVARQLYAMNKKLEAETVIMYLAIKCYSQLIFKMFPLAIKKEVMMYTIQTLSNRFKYSKLQSNYNVVKDTTLKAVETYYKLLIDFDDAIYPTLFNQIFNRLKNNYKLVAQNYYDNYHNRRYLNTVKTTDDETNSQIDREDSSGLISALADSTTNILLTKMPNMAIIRDISRQSGVSLPSMVQCLDEMRKRHPTEKVHRLVSSILQLVYDSDHTLLNRVKSKDFIVTARRQISIATSSNPALLVVKQESDDILEKYCSKFVETSRAATKTQYRQAIYFYIIYVIVEAR